MGCDPPTLMETTMKQEFCPVCGGIVKLIVNGQVIPVLDWPKYGIAVDANCVC